MNDALRELAEASWALYKAKMAAAEAGLPISTHDAGRPVVVANTFTRRWEMEPYLKAAKKRGIKVRIVEATGNWANVHGVPADAIERMRARWEPIEVGEQDE